MTSRPIQLLLCVPLAMCVTGCSTSRQHAREYVSQGTQSVNNVTRAIYASARSRPDAKVKVLDTYEKDFDTFRAEQRTRFDELAKEIEEQKQKLNTLFGALAKIAISAAPGGGSIAEIANLIADVNGQIKQGVQAKAQAEAVEKKIDTSIAQAKKEMASELEAAIAKVREELQGAASETESTAEEVERVQKELDKTILSVQQAVAAATPEKQKEVRDAILEQVGAMTESDLRDFQIRFKAVLLEETEKHNTKALEAAKSSGKNEAEIEALKASQTEQKKAIEDMSEADAWQTYGTGAGGVGGVIGLAALLRTFGESRGKKDMEELRKRLETVADEVHVMQPSPQGGAPAANTASSQPGTPSPPTT